MVGYAVKSIVLLAALAICWLSLCHDLNMIPVVGAENCDTDLRGFEIECMYYMNKGEPSKIMDPNDRCCKVIQEANIPCCCSHFTQKLDFPPNSTIEDLLNWDKVLHCLNYCGKPLPVGTKCGHYTVPPGPPPK